MPAEKKRKAWKTALVAAAACLALFSLVSMLVVRIVYEPQFGRAERPERSLYLAYGDVAERYPREEARFYSGRNALTGYLYGAGQDKGLLVLAHGIGGGADSYLSEILHFVDAGWRVFAYDCTGSYSSEGAGTRGLPQSAADLDAALTYLESVEAHRGLPVALYGHSWGGYAVAAVLDKGHRVDAAVSVAGYNAPAGVLLARARGMMGGFAYVQYPYLWAYQALLFGSGAWHTALDGINSGGVPVLIIHGTADDVITYGGTGIIAQRSKITNPNAEYKTCGKEGQNGHNSLFMSAEAIAYMEDAQRRYQELMRAREGEDLEEAVDAFYAGIDRERASRPDPEFFGDVDAFLDRALGGGEPSL